MFSHIVPLSRCPVPARTCPQGGRVHYTHAAQGHYITERGVKLSSFSFLFLKYFCLKTEADVLVTGSQVAAITSDN